MLSAQDCNTISSDVIPVLEHLLMRPQGAQSDLLEHQLKQMLRDAGIPVLASQLIAKAQDLKRLRLSYPIVLKSQVHSNRLASAGGVATITNKIDAITEAHRLFDTQIQDEYPEYLLAEELHSADCYVGLGIKLNSQTGEVLLQGWRLDNQPSCDAPGASSLFPDDRSAPLARPRQIALDPFSRPRARQLGERLGLSGPSLETLGDIVEKMHILLEWLNLQSLVIEPLAFDHDGKAIALGGQIRFVESALEQQPQLKKLFSPKPEVTPPVVQLEGNIGILSNGMGRAMTTVDSLKQAGGEAAAFVSVKEQQGAVARQVHKAVRQSRRTQERMGQALENLARLKHVKLILVNWSGLAGSCREVAETIVSYLHMTNQHRHLRGTKLPVPLVVRLTGPEAEQGRSLLQEAGIVAVESLEEAIAEGIGLAKMRGAT